MATKKPTTNNSKTPAAKGRPAGLLTWVTAGVAVVIVAVLVILNVTKSSPSQNDTSGATTSSAIVSQLASIPASTFNTVGVTSSVIPVTAPQVFSGKPALTYKVNGKSLPGVFYDGAEYCPYCAAERWSLIAALDRFGSFSGLTNMSSSATDYAPNTPTFSFLKATYSSKYIVFTSVESQDVNRNPLQTPTALESALIVKYDTAKYFPGLAGSSGNPIPFMSFANQFLVSGASYDPGVLSGQTREQIAAGLKSPSSPITQAIIASANYQTAAICTLTGGKPGKVCSSKGVKAAAKKMGL